MSRPLVIVGAGGHGRETLDIVRAVNAERATWEFLGFVADEPPDPVVLARLEVTYLGSLDTVRTSGWSYVIGIGSAASRRRVAESLEGRGCVAAVLVHPSASVGADVELCPGVLLAAGARVTTNVRLGLHSQLNVNSSVSHDCRVGDFVTVSPGAVVCGAVVLEDDVYVGANACIRQGLRIGARTTVGAGSVVVRDVDADLTVVGTPARPLR